MSEDILKASLKDDTGRNTQTYDLNMLFYVAFFGGVIPTIVLGTANLKWLKIDKRIANLLITVGVIILIAKAAVYGLISGSYFVFDSRYLRWGSRIAAVILYLVYYAVMKEKYRQHLLLDGQVKPILNTAVKWVVIAMVIEAVLLFSGRLIIKNVL